MSGIFHNRYGEMRIGWIFLIGVAVIATLIFAGANLVDKPVCERTAAEMGVNSNWGFWHGCLIEVDGKVIPLSNYIVNSETRSDND